MTGRWTLRKLFPKSEVKRMRQVEEDRICSSGLIEIGDFRIDTVGCSATLRGQPLDLTAEELDVLVFLARHPQRLVTPQTVLVTNWTSDVLHQTEFLKALLSLRKKLDAVERGKQYLRTEPWVVYRFDPNSSCAA